MVLWLFLCHFLCIGRANIIPVCCFRKWWKSECPVTVSYSKTTSGLLEDYLKRLAAHKCAVILLKCLPTKSPGAYLICVPSVSWTNTTMFVDICTAWLNIGVCLLVCRRLWLNSRLNATELSLIYKPFELKIGLNNSKCFALKDKSV